MENVFFLTRDPQAPIDRWLAAFPEAQVLSEMPGELPAKSLIWLHNDLPKGEWRQLVNAPFKYVVLFDDPTDGAGMQALSAGAAGFTNTFAAVDVLTSIASVVRNGGLWVGESLLNDLIGKLSTRSTQAGRQQTHESLQRLSEREREVALLVVNGDSNKEIARKLDVAERTVKAHLTAIFEKLSVRDRLQLAVLLNS